MRAICYYRHSTDNSQQDENSIPRQRFACQKFASRLGWTIVDEIEDKGESGAGDKKNLMALASEVQQGVRKFDVLLVDSQSRVTRKNAFRIFEDIQWLDLNGVKISCVDENDVEPTTVESWATDPAKVIKIWQNHQTVLEAAEKATDGLFVKHQEKRLSWAAPTPFGMTKVEAPRPEGSKDTGKPYTKLIPNSDGVIVRELFEKYLAGSSVRGLVTVLGKGKKYRNGNNPVSTAVKTILRNPIYCGIWAYGVRNVGKHRVLNEKTPRRNWHVNNLKMAASIWEDYCEPIISKEMFLEVQDKLDDKQQTHSGRPSKKNYRYGGLFKCGCCGGAITPQKRTKRNQRDGIANPMEQVDYRCVASITAGPKCREGVRPWAKQITQEEFDEAFKRFFAEEISLKASFHWNLIEFLAEEMKKTSFSAKAGLSDRLAELKIVEMQIEKDYDKLGHFPDFLVKRQQELYEEKKEILAQLDSATPVSTYVKEKVERFKSGIEDEAGRYMTLLYDVLTRYADDEYKWDEEKKKTETFDLVERFFNEMPAGTEVDALANDKDELVGFTFCDPATVVQMLKAMGFVGGQVNFRKTSKDEGRGLRWIVDSIAFDFSWADENGNMLHTPKCVLHIPEYRLALVHNE